MSEPMHEPMDDLLAMTGRAPRGRPDVDALWQRGRWRRRAPMAAGIASGLVLVVGVAFAAPMVAPSPAPVVGPGLGGIADLSPAPDETLEPDESPPPSETLEPDESPPPSETTPDPSDSPVQPGHGDPPGETEPPRAQTGPDVGYGADLWDRRFVAIEIVRDRTPVTSASPNGPWVEFAREGWRDVARYSGGCNTSGGLLAIWPNRLDIDTDGASTQIGCEPELHEQDDWFFAFMAADPWWSWEDEFLVLIVGRDRVTLVEQTD
jgi:heat shock protein HslJ